MKKAEQAEVGHSRPEQSIDLGGFRKNTSSKCKSIECVWKQKDGTRERPSFCSSSYSGDPGWTVLSWRNLPGKQHGPSGNCVRMDLI